MFDSSQAFIQPFSQDLKKSSACPRQIEFPSGKVKSVYIVWAKGTHQAGTYLNFYCMKQLRVILLSYG